MHYRQEILIQQELSKYSSITHRYQGKEHTVTYQNIGDFDRGFLQSLSTRLSKEYPKPKKVKMPGRGNASDKGQGYDKRVDETFNMQILIKKELHRLSLSESIVEEKLNYPMVFQKLITEPHLALEQFRQTRELYQELYLFIDAAVGYNSNDKGFHHTLYSEAQKIKGVKSFTSVMLRFDNDYYIQKLPRMVPKGKKIIVFTQGCGGSCGEVPNGYHVHFVTHFKKGENCGCDTISNHEEMSVKTKRVTMHYGIDTPQKLSLLQI